MRFDVQSYVSSAVSSVPVLGAVAGAAFAVHTLRAPIEQDTVRRLRQSFIGEVRKETGIMVCRVGALVGKVLGSLCMLWGATTIALQLNTEEALGEDVKMGAIGFFAAVIGHTCIQTGAALNQLGNELQNEVPAPRPVPAAPKKTAVHLRTTRVQVHKR